jgi:hypothetical protein
MSFKITAESDLWESRGTFTLVTAIGPNQKSTATYYCKYVMVRQSFVSKKMFLI